MIKNLIAFLALASMAQAANITFQNFADDFGAFRPVATAAGTAIKSGEGFAAVGYFTITDADIKAGGESLKTAFKQFGNEVSFGAGFGVDGIYKGVQSQDIGSADDPFNGKNIYTIIGNKGSLAESTELLVYKSAQTFGVDAPLFVETSNIVASPTGENELLFGSFGGAQVEIAGTSYAAFSLATVVAVPEPASLSMVGLGALALLRRKRR